jgi:hypothetical protein
VTDRNYKLIKTTIIPAVTEVRFYTDTVEKIKEGHPEVPIELPSIMDAAEKAIVAPTHIETSYGNSYVYVDAESTNVSGDPLRVPVKMVTGSSARVKSVYFASTESEHNVIWRRSDG